jgi:hypothetical protein
MVQLRPNKRYFMNIRPVAAVKPGDANGCDKHFPDITKRDGHSICWRLLVGRSNSYTNDGSQANTAPYAGPCLTEGPYPENYNSETCGESMTKACVDQGELLPDRDTVNAIDVTCYDPTNQKAPQRFARECRTGGQQLAWTVGYRKPAYSDYLCEPTNADVTSGICAIHREGQMRERRCTSEQGAAMSQYIEQCLYDHAQGRFQWIKLTNRVTTLPGNMRCEVVPYERPLAKDTCQFNGQEYAMGTVQTVTCHVSLDNRSASMTRTCQKMQVGAASDSQSSVPVFVRTGGEFISEGEMKTNPPYNCTFSYNPPKQ